MSWGTGTWPLEPDLLVRTVSLCWILLLAPWKVPLMSFSFFCKLIISVSLDCLEYSIMQYTVNLEWVCYDTITTRVVVIVTYLDVIVTYLDVIVWFRHLM